MRHKGAAPIYHPPKRENVSLFSTACWAVPEILSLKMASLAGETNAGIITEHKYVSKNSA
jgi:hypothetical protein